MAKPSDKQAYSHALGKATRAASSNELVKTPIFRCSNQESNIRIRGTYNQHNKSQGGLIGGDIVSYVEGLGQRKQLDDTLWAVCRSKVIR